MHVHSEPVAGAVEIELAIPPEGDGVVDGSWQQLEIHHPFGEDPDRDGMHFGIRKPRLAGVDHRFLGGEHEFVDGTLWGCEGAVDREGTGDVGREVPDLGGSVDEEQVPVLHLTIVLHVVEDAGVIARGHDRGVSLANRPKRPEGELHGSLHVVFGQTRPGEADCFGMAFGRDPARLAEGGDLVLAFDQPHLAEDGGGVADGGGDRVTGAEVVAAGLAGRGEHYVIDGSAEVIPEGLPSPESVAQHLGQFVNGIGGVGAVVGDGSVDACPQSVPCLHFPIPGPHEQYVRSRVGRVEQRHCVWFGKTGQEEEVGRLAKRVLNIVVSGGLACAGHDRDVLPDAVHELLAALVEAIHGSESPGDS